MHANVFFLFLVFPLIPLVMFLRNPKKESLYLDVPEKQLEIKREIMDDICRSVSCTKRKYKNDLINKKIMLSKDFERLKRKIDKSKINENYKRELMEYLNSI